MSATGRNLPGKDRHADDFYSTPAWCVKAILPKLSAFEVIIDPCCGDGAIFRAMPRYIECEGFDINLDRVYTARRWGASAACADSLTYSWGIGKERSDYASRPSRFKIITNPPYALALEFVARSFTEAHPVVEKAFLLRLGFLASAKRAAFHRSNPCDVYVLPKRPSFTGDGKTDASDYAWFVWGEGRGNRWEVLDVPVEGTT